MTRSRLLAAVAALVLAIVGVIGMVAYVNGAEERATAGEQLADVWVVDQRVPAGTAGDQLEAYLRQDSVPAKLVNRNTIGDLSDVAEFVNEVPLLPGELLSAGRFVDPASFERQLERVIDVPPGLQEVTLALEPERAGGGLINPGDTVGVIMSFDPFDVTSDLPIEIDGKIIPPDASTDTTTHQTLHKLLVTNIQLEEVPEVAEREGIGDEQAKQVRLVPSGNLLVTFAADIDTAEKLIFGHEFGRLWLTSEPNSTIEEPSQIQTRATIYEDLDEDDEGDVADGLEREEP